MLAATLLGLAGYAGAEFLGLAFVFGVILPYAAAILFLAGCAWRLYSWGRVPVPFRIPTSGGQQKSLPGIASARLDNPHTALGVLGRLFLEAFFFRSLFRNTRAQLRAGGRLAYWPELSLWAGALAFHASFAVIALRHLRFFTEPTPWCVNTLAALDGFFEVGRPVLYASTGLFLAALTFLLLRRLLEPNLRYLSLFGDYFPLFLLLGLGTTGVLLRHFVRPDLTAVKELVLGLAAFQPAAPAGLPGFFYAHLCFLCALLAVLPFTKLAHFLGLFLSPTRNQANNNRMVRHVNPWNYPVKVHTYEAYEDEFREKMIQAGIPVDRPADGAGKGGAE